MPAHSSNRCSYDTSVLAQEVADTPDGSCPDDPGEKPAAASKSSALRSTTPVATSLPSFRTRMYLTDPAVADAVSAVHGQLLGDVRPAATMVILAGLLDIRWKVEVEAEALIANYAVARETLRRRIGHWHAP